MMSLTVMLDLLKNIVEELNIINQTQPSLHNLLILNQLEPITILSQSKNSIKVHQLPIGLHLLMMLPQLLNIMLPNQQNH